MKSQEIVFISIIVLEFMAPAFGEVTYISRVFETVYKSTITNDALENALNWKEGENPPFSSRNAISLADRRRKELVKDGNVIDGNVFQQISFLIKQTVRSVIGKSITKPSFRGCHRGRIRILISSSQWTGN